MRTPEELKFIVNEFALESALIQIRPLGPGFINETFIAETQEGAADYILQRKNKNIFKDVPAMMQNICAVTDHIRKKVVNSGGDPSKEVMTVISTKEGVPYFQDKDGEYWTMCRFIEGSKTFERADTPELAYMGGKGIGRFQSLLADFEGNLSETIKGFHNIHHRFEQWDESLKRDKASRVKSLAKEIEWIESRRSEMLAFWNLVEKGDLPRRVTHNDTKISNILFDTKGDVLCVIDLDTVMSSTSLNDYGDAIRSYANTGDEDDKDISNVGLNLEIFKEYTRGYLEERLDTLTETEIKNLAFAARYITFEQVLRFLMDYIDGDTYYKTSYPDHNLVRTHAQYALLESMERDYPEMCRIVEDLQKALAKQ